MNTHNLSVISEGNRPPINKQMRWIAVIVACVMILAACSGVWVYMQRAPYARLASVKYPTENAPCHNASATSSWIYTPPMTITELALKATHIVCADVLQEHREVNENYTRYFLTLRIRTVLKGTLKPGDEILYADNGVITHFESGPRGNTHDGGPLLEKGNRVILFMSDKDAKFKTADGSETYHYADTCLSKFFLDADRKFHVSGTYSEWYEKYGSCDMPHQLTDYTPLSYKDMAALIKAAE